MVATGVHFLPRHTVAPAAVEIHGLPRATLKVVSGLDAPVHLRLWHCGHSLAVRSVT